MTDPIQTFFGIKVTTLAASFIMALLAVLLDIRRHSFVTGVLAVICGMAVAVLATDPIVANLNLPGDWSHAVAGVLGISGRNLVIWVGLVSKDPLAAWNRWRGKEPKKDA